MRSFFGAAILFLTTVGQLAAQDCTCTEVENLFFFTTVNENEVEYMEEMPWKFDHCVGDTVYVNLVGDGDPEIDTYAPDTDGNDVFYIDGKWVRYDQLPAILKNRCQQGTS